METTKPFNITHEQVRQAYKDVADSKGAGGVDKQTLEDFARNLEDNLYKLWNRMSSGTYYPPPVKAVLIPKKSGGKRILGVPTVTDRIAQMVVKQIFEPQVNKYFYPDSYGYRKGKSQHVALEVTRDRCWKYAWVVEYDIRKLFDEIDHELLMKAVEKHTDNKLVILYIKRWITTPMQMPNGKLVERTKGVTQGGVISPVLANLFLHYAIDVWLKKKFPGNPWCRYADDGLIHCYNEKAAKVILKSLIKRLEECKLQINLEKTRIVYCKEGRRKEKYPITSFDFLGYTFRPQRCKNRKTGEIFTGFNLSASKETLKAMRTRIRKDNVRNRSELTLEEVADWYNPILRGWQNYYGKFQGHSLNQIWRHFNRTLMVWAGRKYLQFRRAKLKAKRFLESIIGKRKSLFVHWQLGCVQMVA